MKMTVVEKHTTLDMIAALKEECDLLRNDITLDKSKLDSTFNPMQAANCFMGKLFGQGPVHEPEKVWEYRHRIGAVPNDGESLYRTGDMTPLEVWSAENWKDNENKVLAIVAYIKGEGEFPDLT